MELHFQCDLSDYREAQPGHLRSSPAYYVMLALGSMAVLYGSYLAYFVDFYRGLLIQLVGIFWLLWPSVARRPRMRRDFRKHPNFSVVQTLVIEEAGLQTISDIAEGSVKRSAFVKFHETSNLFLLYMGSRMFRVIPKRACTCAQVEELRQLLKSKLPEK